jgi:predicted ATPase
MRIDRLRLPSFRNLINFEIDFNQASGRQVIVGRNGVGKSNLLEAIVRIFRDLDLEESSTFEYEIEYICRAACVRIICVQEPATVGQRKARFERRYEVELEGSEAKLGQRLFVPVSESNFYKRNRPVGQSPNPERLLPRYVFGYYSGDLSRFQHIFERHEEKYYQEQIKGTESPLRPLFLARPMHSQFALLSFFATADDRVRKFLRTEMRIEGLDAALFALRQPYWSKARKAIRDDVADQRFWGAAGKVEPFLERLFDHSFAPMAFSERIKSGVARTETVERRMCYVVSEDELSKLGEGLTNKEFFARLESLVFSSLVGHDGNDVRVWLRLRDVPDPVTFVDLAEGERQLLTVLGLLRFTAEDEALFILDEPDTHLNPAWCLDYLENLRRYGADLSTSQIIMTTHSPMTFAGLDRDEVVVLKRTEDGIIAEHPTSSPKGMGFGAILTSEIFGLRSTLDKDTLTKVEDLRFLAAKDNRSSGEEEKLAELNSELSHLGFASEFRDPLYKEFVNEMASARESDPDLWGQVLTTVQRDRRARLVQGAVQRLRANRERE